MTKYFILAALWLGLPAAALATGIQVLPDHLNFPVGQTTQQVTVANPTASPQTFQIYAEDFASAIAANPNDFAIQPGGRRDVTVTLDPAKLPAGGQTSLDVLAKPVTAESGGSLDVATGVKIPLTFALQTRDRASIPNDWLPAITLGLAIILVLLYFYIIRLRQTKLKTGKHSAQS